MKVFFAAAALALGLSSAAGADAPAPDVGRQVTYCAARMSVLSTQRDAQTSAQAEQIATLQAQLTLAQADLTVANARIAALTPKPAPAAKK